MSAVTAAMSSRTNGRFLRMIRAMACHMRCVRCCWNFGGRETKKPLGGGGVACVVWHFMFVVLPRFNEPSLKSFVVLSFDRSYAETAIGLVQQLTRSDRMIDLADLMIGATAQTHGIPLETFNVRHFERLDGLTIVSSQPIYAFSVLRTG